MDLYSGSDGGGVRLLHYASSGQFRVADAAASSRKSDNKAFPFRFRRRSKSAPRSKQSSVTRGDKPSFGGSGSGGFITYSANGEKIRSNKESPSKPDKVELVGFTRYRTDTSLKGDHHQEDEANSAFSSLSESLKSHESRTSANIKMERERLRRERLNSTSSLRPWATSTTSTAHAPLAEDRKHSAAARLLSAAASEREKFFEEARERFFAQTAAMTATVGGGNGNSSNDLFNQFLREREERLARLTTRSCHQPAAAFLLPRPPPASSSVLRSSDSPLVCRRLQLGAGVGPVGPGPSSLLAGTGSCGGNQLTGVTEGGADSRQNNSAQETNKSSLSACFAEEGRRTGRAEIFDPKTSQVKHGEITSPEMSSQNAKERVIPIQILSEPMLPELLKHNQQQAVSTTTQEKLQDDRMSIVATTANIDLRRPPLFQSLLADMRAAATGSDPAAMGGFATTLGGFGARFMGVSSGQTSDSDDLAVQLRPVGDRSATAIRESFPGFPSFGNFPSFAVPLLPGDRLNLSPRSRSRHLRLAKSKSTADCPTTDGLRYVADSSQEEEEEEEGSYDSNNINNNSETESEDDDLDSVSVIADRTRDRLSGTGSTLSAHSHDLSSHSGNSAHSDSTISNSSTHSRDSGIAEGEEQPRPPPTKPPRPISGVPSEYSDISTNSSDSGELGNKTASGCHKKSLAPYRVDARPLIIGQGSKTSATEVLSDETSSLAGSVVGGGGGSSEGESSVAGDVAEKPDKAYLIANELLTTEIHYVSRLHLIDQVFHFRVDQENRTSALFPPETVTTIFSNIKSIYKFHAEFLLPQLKERMASWHSSPELQKIGDIMMRNAPFLKMYTEYVKNFDNAMTAINLQYAKNPKFATILDEIHRLPECESLSLQHHMLSPIQRIPRYELLLRDYIQKLPDSSPDRADAQSALRQVSQAAAHANDSMKRIEQFKKLLEVQDSIGGAIDLVSPTREVLKEGKIVKISARTGDHQDRYLFLLSDLLLLCSPRKSMLPTSSSGPQYGLRARFHVETLQVLEGDNLVTANTFYVRDEHKTVELYPASRREKEEWLEALYHAIKCLYTRKASLRVDEEDSGGGGGGGTPPIRDLLRPLDSEIGRRPPPHMQRPENVNKCADCSAQFSILKHKHNCRTCGAVFCGRCSEYKYPLPWEEGRKGRVCRTCHAVLANSGGQVALAATIDLSSRPRGLLEVPANSNSAVHSGWLVLRTPGSKPAPAKRFFLLLPDFVLYSYRSEADTAALTATPVPGFTVHSGLQLKGDSNAPDKDRDRIVKLVHPPSKRTYYFAGTNAKDVERWVELLTLASRAEPLLEEETLQNSDAKSTSSTEYENS